MPNITVNPDYLSVATVFGDHGATGAMCIASDIFYFGSQEFTTYETPVKHGETNCGTTNESTCAVLQCIPLLVVLIITILQIL